MGGWTFGTVHTGNVERTSKSARLPAHFTARKSTLPDGLGSPSHKSTASRGTCQVTSFVIRHYDIPHGLLLCAGVGILDAELFALFGGQDLGDFLVQLPIQIPLLLAGGDLVFAELHGVADSFPQLFIFLAFRLASPRASAAARRCSGVTFNVPAIFSIFGL